MIRKTFHEGKLRELFAFRYRRLALSLTFILLLIAISVTLIFRPSNDFPVNSPGVEVLLSIGDGATGTEIAQQMQRMKIIKNAKVLIELMGQNTASRGIAPGVHRLDTHIPSSVSLQELLDPKRLEGVIKVIPGSTQSDVLSLVHGSHQIVNADNLNTLRPPISNPLNSLEGQLFPSNYSFAAGTSSHQAFAKMLNHFGEVIARTKLRKALPGYTPYQVLTIASLIQIEADQQDYAKAAAVIYNRLRIGMALQLNSTVQYALNQRGSIALSIKATTFPSAYNTYLHTGLPPTPISNPGLEAIDGALHPAHGNWLYFITVKPHDTRFTNSFRTFQSWVNIYEENLKKGLFK